MEVANICWPTPTPLGGAAFYYILALGAVDWSIIADDQLAGRAWQWRTLGLTHCQTTI